MRLYKSTRLYLENKSEEFEKAGCYSHEKEYRKIMIILMIEQKLEILLINAM